jgi:cyclohexyl-isocyanide hydratase
MTISPLSDAGGAAGPAKLTIGLVMFEGMTQLDLTGPYEVLSRMPNTRVCLVANNPAAVVTEFGLSILPDTTFEGAPRFDVLCVPGGWGVNGQMENAVLLDFLRKQGSQAAYVSSVCSGSLLLGAAGLLQGYRATTHWMSLDILSLFGATPVAERVVRDRNRVTGAGVTAGIDFALVLAAELFGEDVARRIQLAVEYEPEAPFDSGSPRMASDALRTSVLSASAVSLSERRAIAERAAERLHHS